MSIALINKSKIYIRHVNLHGRLPVKGRPCSSTAGNRLVVRDRTALLVLLPKGKVIHAPLGGCHCFEAFQNEVRNPLAREYVSADDCCVLILKAEANLLHLDAENFLWGE